MFFVYLHPDFNNGKKFKIMSRVCDLTGKRAMVGNNVSHAMNKTKRKFSVNLVKKKFYLAEEDRWITLRVAASTIKTINKKGLAAVLKDAQTKGLI